MVGHGHAGKTTLVSAMLYTAGATPRLGRVDDGSATTDSDEEEIARKMSISASAAHVEWGKTKINVIDTPGFNMFVHEARMVLPVVDAAIVVVDGVAGVEVVTQRVWNDCEEYKTPRLIGVNRMDRDRANAELVLESLINAFGRNVIPIELPIGSEKNLSGVVDLVRMKAYTYELGGNGKGKETEIPANMRAQVQEAHEQLVELVAEGDDKLMEEFFEKGTIPEEDLIPALHNAIREDKLFPVIFSSGLGNVGAVAKLKATLTGDTLGDKAAPILYPRVKLPEPAITFAIEPKSRADEDKLGPGIHKLMEEDAMLRFFRDAQTQEFLIAGTGQQHIEVVVAKLKKRYHTEVVLKAPKVPYRETIRGKADVQGRHKKQTGGHGQYGDCKIKMEPMPRRGQFEFVNDI